MPSDRAALIRFVIALAALSAVPVVLLAAASRESRNVVVIVRTTPTPALASVAVRP